MKNIWKLLMIALLAFAMIGCPATKEDDDDDNGTGGDGTPAISWWLSSDTTEAGEPQDPEPYFPYGFKFTTKAGWSAQYVFAGRYASDDEDGADNYAKPVLGLTAKAASGDDPAIITSANMVGPYDTVDASGDLCNLYDDGSTKIYVNESELTPGALYKLTFTPTSFTSSNAVVDDEATVAATVALAAAGAGATETNLTADQTNDAADDIYISGPKGSAWAGDDAISGAKKLQKNGDGSYTFIWKSPDVSTNISLKIKFKDLSTDADFTYVTLTNVPVSMAGGEIEGSIFSWGGGTDAGVIAPKQGATSITGGDLYEVTATAAENASWGTSHVTAPENGYSFANDFHTPDATGAIMLSIGGVKKLVPYIKGQSKIFNWAVAKEDKAP